MELKDLVVEYRNIITDEECETFIKWFENNKQLHSEGKIDQKKGTNTDLVIKKAIQAYPHPEDEISHLITDIIFRAYDNYSKTNLVPKNREDLCVRDYSIRVYKKNDGHFLLHSDQSIGSITRVFAIIMYFNDVKIGGETEFPEHNILIKPEKGKVLIFPCNYLFYHQGNVPISDNKYIGTAFVNYISSTC